MENNKQNNVVIRERNIPASRDNEVNCLGLCLKDREAISNISGVLRSSEDFYWEEHKHIYSCIIDLYNQNLQVDSITLIDELTKRGLIGAVNGKPYIDGLVDVSVNVDKAEEYAKRVLDWAVIREVRMSCEKTLEVINSGEITSPMSLIDSHTKEVMESGSRVTTGSVYTMEELAKESILSIENAYSGKTNDIYIPTGFKDFDAKLTGTARGEFHVIAARANVGKTACCVQMALNSVEATGLPAILFSLEMSKAQLMNRIISIKSKVPAKLISNGNMTSKQYDEVKKAIKELSQLPIHIDETSGINIMDIKSKTKKIINKYGPVGIVMIDYIQLVDPIHRHDDTHVSLRETSKRVKAMAKETNVALWAVSQLNRNVESRQNKRPIMSDIAGSDGIVADADVISLLYDESYYEDKKSFVDNNQGNWAKKQQVVSNAAPPQSVVEFIVDKNRNGDRGSIKLVFERATTSFKDYYESSY